MMGACVRAASYMLLLFSFISVCSGVHRCSTKERRALLEFKQALTDPSNRLSSWSSDDDDDCCQWAGVGCHNITAAVTLLDLHNPYFDDEYGFDPTHALGGNISHSLLQLESLTYLDLSGNDFEDTPIPSFFGSITNLRHLDLYSASFGGIVPNQLQNLSNIRYLNLGENNFQGTPIPSFFGSMTSLRYLDLYSASFGGIVPNQLQNLSNIRYLNLGENDFQGTPIPSFFGSMTSLRHLDLNFALFGGLVPSQLQNLSNIRYLDLAYNSGLRADSLGWIAHLRSLEYLDMSHVDLHNIEADWLQSVSMPPSLSQLHLSFCQLGSMIPPPGGHVNFSSLQVLDLSHNSFSSRIHCLFNLSCSLRHLDLSSNSLSGAIPPGIGQLNHLQYLFLNDNKLNGSIPWSIGNLTSLRELPLSNNQLSGTIPESISFLSNLESLLIDSNPKVRGVVSEGHLSGLSKLKFLYLCSPTLSLSVGRHWTPPFQLYWLDMSFSKVGPAFPSWLRSQTSLKKLDISMSGISDTIPDWFWKFASGIPQINLSGNQIHGDLTHAWFNSITIDISSNCFDGQLPQLSPNVEALSIRNNSLSGRISTFICGESNRNNQLRFLDISMNRLSGELSECWRHWQSLDHLNLGSNNLSGTIPSTIGSLYNLRALQLSQNRLFGDIPLSLSNCSLLGFINLGENQLSGPIPYWIGNSYNTELGVLRLRSNKFTGSIPVQLCQLSSIQVLDLGNNNLSGTIPKCLSHLYSMVDAATNSISWTVFNYPMPNDYPMPSDDNSFGEPLQLVTKGTELIYERNLRLVTLIDFSNNMLSGTIPTNISRFAGLHFLNLSQNHLVGEIPKEVGNMSNLESLDLSRNQLSGKIPESMSKLSFLSHLDLSYNNLSGSIPRGSQLESFSESSFLGNVGLCGAPLSKNCRDDTRQESKPPAKEDGGQKSDDNMFWFYIGVGPGFACAFCGVCSTLYFKAAWRQALFWFLEDMLNIVYVFTYVRMNRIKRRLQRSDNNGTG